MPEFLLRRTITRLPPIPTATVYSSSFSSSHCWSKIYSTTVTSLKTLGGESTNRETKNERWFTLPPFVPTVDVSALGKKLSVSNTKPIVDAASPQASFSSSTTATITAFKWVRRCCPKLPYSLLQKLFRLKQVRRRSLNTGRSFNGVGGEDQSRLKRVAADDAMNTGDRIILPISVEEKTSRNQKKLTCNEEEVEYIRSLELYKDRDIIAINKPPGMAVQGGSGVKWSLDDIAAQCLQYDYPDPPRLVHRLDRDSSGVVVMGRTRESVVILHSVFRDKTRVSTLGGGDGRRILQKRYWAVVIGYPGRSGGIISAPLGKVSVDGGRSERVMIIEKDKALASHHAVTEYRVLASSDNGLTCLELCPVTGRKHQLRVHCASVLGTPILGDYKYGCRANKKLNEKGGEEKEEEEEEEEEEEFPFLYLHCRQMVLPDVSKALRDLLMFPDQDTSQLQPLRISAPLPPHMHPYFYPTISEV